MIEEAIKRLRRRSSPLSGPIEATTIAEVR